MNKVFFSLFMFPLLAFADSKGGGGGVGIACYQGENLISVELLDIFEARTNRYSLKADFSGDIERDVKAISKNIFKNDQEADSVLEIMRRYKNIPSDADLVPTNDAYPVSLPRGCVFKQIVTYYNDYEIYRDFVLYKKLSYSNQLALAFHEYIYAQERKLGVPDSRYTRTIVGLAFSNMDPFMKVSSDEYTHICKSADERTSFYGRKYSSKGNVWKLSFITLNGHRMFSEKYGYFPIADDTSLGDYRRDNPYGQREEIETYNYALSSKINGEERMRILSNKDFIQLTWEGSDPRDKFQNVAVNCQTVER